MSDHLTTNGRNAILDGLANSSFDVLVIGGGITGAGIALDAQSRGLRVALVEMQDFAAGTSSRSTKLVHGGLRYLKQFAVKMVAEVGKERTIVYENGPHVTTPEWILLPIFAGGTFGKRSTSFGLWVYDFLAGVKKNERRKMLDRDATIAKEPLLKKDGLLGGGIYVEYRTDDARLTLEVLKKAVSLGAKAANYVKVDKFLYKHQKIAGAIVTDQLTGKTAEIHAAKIVNAAGPWVDELRQMDGSKTGKTLHITKGVHLVFDGKRFPLSQAVYFDVADGRMVFAIPRGGKTYVGTTDTNYAKDKVHPKMTAEDRDYLLTAVNAMFPEVRLTANDVESSWVGLRPLIHEEGKDPSEISRKDEVFIAPSGLISIAGGKLTGYRKMAEKVVDIIAKQLQRETGKQTVPCLTRTLAISGGDVGGSAGFGEFVRKNAEWGAKLGLPKEAAERLAKWYGANVTNVFERIPRYENEGKKTGLPLDIWLMLSYAVEAEMAATPADFLIRRTGWLFFNRPWVQEWKEPVIAAMATMAGWPEATRQKFTEQFAQLFADAVTPEKNE
ncbi:MAG TPA: FAD-dependent oxidoreductase [Bacilli bacterium]